MRRRCKAARAPTKTERVHVRGGASTTTHPRAATEVIANSTDAPHSPSSLARPCIPPPPPPEDPVTVAASRECGAGAVVLRGDLLAPGEPARASALLARGYCVSACLRWCSRELAGTASTVSAGAKAVEIAPRNPRHENDRRSHLERPGAPACRRMHKGTTSTRRICDQNHPLGSMTTSSYARIKVFPGGCWAVGSCHFARNDTSTGDAVSDVCTCMQACIRLAACWGSARKGMRSRAKLSHVPIVGRCMG